MVSLVVRRTALEGPLNEDAALTLMEDHWWSDAKVKRAFKGMDDFWVVLLSMLKQYRVEGYLFDDKGVALAAVVYSRQLDIHHGLVAAPILTLVHTEHRGNRQVGRQVSNLVKRVVDELNADKYLVCHHVNDTTQIHKLRYRNGRS